MRINAVEDQENCYIIHLKPITRYGSSRPPFHFINWESSQLKTQSLGTEGPYSLAKAQDTLATFYLNVYLEDRDPVQFCPSNLEEVLSEIGPDQNGKVSALIIVLKPDADKTQGNILDNLEKVVFYNKNCEDKLEETPEYKSGHARFVQAQNRLKKLYDEQKETTSVQFQRASKEYYSALDAQADLVKSKKFREFSGEAIRQALARPAAAPINNPKSQSSPGLFSISSPPADEQDSSQRKGCTIC